MAGLLDVFDDPKNVGLLSAAAQMLAASGPSRTPTSLGQIMGGGITGGLQAMQQAQQQQLAAKHLGMQNDILSMNKQKMETDLAKQKRIEDAYKSFYGNATPTSDVSAQVAAPAPLDNPAFPRQAMPDWATKQPSPAQAPATPTTDNYTRHLQFAQFLDSRGLGEEASKYYDLAEKFKPKIKDQKTLTQNGKPVNVITYEDGRQVVSQFGALPDNQIINLGGKQIVVDKNQALNGQSWNNTMTPGEQASNSLGWANNNLARQRFTFDQGQASQPQFNAEMGGFVSKPTAQAPSGGFTPLAGYNKPEKPLTESQGKATAYSARMMNADGIINNLVESGTKTPSLIKQAAEGVPLIGGALGMGANAFASGEQQKLEQAQRDFVNAILRQESGAAISPAEFDNAKKQYFPQPNDDAATIEQKARNRQIAIQGMKAQAGEGSKKADAIAGNQNQQRSKFVNIDGVGSVAAQLGADGNYYVVRGGKKYRVEE